MGATSSSAGSRLVYSHKTHEKCADILLTRLKRIKIAQISLSALTTGGLIAVIFGTPEQSRVAPILSAIVSSVLLALNFYTKETDLGQSTQKHKETADQLWGIREDYLSLLTDMQAGEVATADVRSRRDSLKKDLKQPYPSARRTFSTGYKKASEALKVKKALTFSSQEIDQFLPAPLRKSKS